MAPLTFLEDGDEVIFLNLGYPPNEVRAKYAGAHIKHMPLTKPDWQFDIKQPDTMITPKTTLLITNTPTNVAAFIQKAAYAAMVGPQELTVKKTQLLQKKRDKMVAGLNSIPGIKCGIPSGAFYAFPNIMGTGLTSQEFTNRLMENAGFAVVAGTAFGSQGEGYVRVTYTVSDSDIDIDEGTRRIRETNLWLRA